MSKISKNKLLCLLILSFFFSLGVCSPIDPFYLNLLKAGEAAFQAQNYQEAIKILDVAVFGLHGEKKLAAKAYSFLSLSYVLAGEKAKGRQAFSAAAALVGEEGFASLDFNETVRKDLGRVFGPLLEAGGPGRMAPSAPIKAEAGSESSTPAHSEKIAVPWTKASEIEPPGEPEDSSVSLYFKRYAAYHQTGDFNSAKKMLLVLLQSHPNEYRAYFLLARIEFNQKKYSKALEHFNQSLNPAGIEGRTLEYGLKSRLYISVCFFRLNMKTRMALSLKSIQEEFPESEITATLREEGLEASWLLIKNKLSGKS